MGGGVFERVNLGMMGERKVKKNHKKKATKTKHHAIFGVITRYVYRKLDQQSNNKKKRRGRRIQGEGVKGAHMAKKSLLGGTVEVCHRMGVTGKKEKSGPPSRKLYKRGESERKNKPGLEQGRPQEQRRVQP